MFGADKDEVLRRGNGFYTYYAVDVAYHRNKFIKRGFDRVIDVWGADHHGHALRFAATMTAPALGQGNKELDFLIMQMSGSSEGTKSSRSRKGPKGTHLKRLAGRDRRRLLQVLFQRQPDTHLEFDLDLAVMQDSENPVYYVQ
jgi:arginyl-tRNA synthetase